MIDALKQWPEWFVELLPGLLVSLELVVATVIIGTPLALILAFMARSHRRILSWTSLVLIEIGRGVPLLIVIYLLYFGLPSANVLLDAFPAAALGLGLNFAAYTADVFKSGLDAVPRGQSEAAQALGLSKRVELQKIILPQATRIVTPPLLSWIIVFFQATSIAFAIAVPELMSQAYSIAATNFQYLSVFILAGLMYAVIAIPGSRLVARMERRQQIGS